MNGTTEKRLTDYRGYQVIKVVDDYGVKKDITYMVNNQDGDNLNCFTNLTALKKWVDLVLK